MESSERAQETPARSGLSWLLAATLVWRLCSFGSESNTLDALFSCLFAALALGFVWQSQFQTKGLGFLRWWLCWALAHLALWPFWPMPFEQVLRLPALLGPVFLAVAMSWAPPSLTGRLPTVLVLSGFAHAVASLWQRFFLYPDWLQQQSELGLTKAQIFRISEGRTLGLSASPTLAHRHGRFICVFGFVEHPTEIRATDVGHRFRRRPLRAHPKRFDRRFPRHRFRGGGGLGGYCYLQRPLGVFVGRWNNRSCRFGFPRRRRADHFKPRASVELARCLAGFLRALGRWRGPRRFWTVL